MASASDCIQFRMIVRILLMILGYCVQNVYNRYYVFITVRGACHEPSWPPNFPKKKILRLPALLFCVFVQSATTVDVNVNNLHQSDIAKHPLYYSLRPVHRWAMDRAGLPILYSLSLDSRSNTMARNAWIRQFYGPQDESVHISEHKVLDVSYWLPTLAKF